MSRKVSNRTLLGAGLTVALGLAFFVSPMASSSPDGLEKVAAEQGIDAGASKNPSSNAPLANYTTAGVGNARLSTGVAGVAGTGLTLALGYGVFALARRSRAREERRDRAASAA